MNAYVREDDSFHIELLQGGRGTPVIVCNGFLSESGKGWGEWYDIDVCLTQCRSRGLFQSACEGPGLVRLLR
jgi:hypothetical protein